MPGRLARNATMETESAKGDRRKRRAERTRKKEAKRSLEKEKNRDRGAEISWVQKRGKRKSESKSQWRGRVGQGLHLEDKSVEGNSKPINYIAFRFKVICGNALTRSVLFRLEHMLNDIYRNIFIVSFSETQRGTHVSRTWLQRQRNLTRPKSSTGSARESRRKTTSYFSLL